MIGEATRLPEVLNDVFGDRPKPIVRTASTAAVNLDDDVLIDKAKAATNGKSFKQLFAGDTSAHGGDVSSADLALCNHLAFWFGGASNRIDRVFRRSGLMRDKWDSPRGSSTYGAMTIETAIASCREYYDPAKANGRKHETNGDGKPTDDALAAIATGTTDVANSARFTIQHRENIRYSHEHGAYIVYTRKRWEWDKSGRAVALAKQTALSIYQEAMQAAEEAKKAHAAGDEQAEAKHAARAGALAKHAAASQKRERISAMLALAQPDIAVKLDQLDADPWLLNALNGTIDLRTGELRPHCRTDFLTKLCRAEYHPNAAAGVFMAFLARIFRTHPPLIGFMQKVFGYTASGSTREQCVFFLFGLGANGKTTLIDAIMYVLADYAGKADPDLLMQRDGASAHPTGIADLFGSRMAVCSETNDGKRFDESRLKDLAGETHIKARRMYGDFFSFVMTAKIFLYSNHRPIVRGTDFGFWRRMKLIPFAEKIDDDEKDRNLAEKLKAEADGILAWIVAGAVAWQRDGLSDPLEVVKATEAYRTDMDSVGLFVADNCIKGTDLKSYAADLYAAYTKFAIDAGEHPLSQKRLGTALAERGFKPDRCTYSNRRMWLGVGLKATKAPEIPEFNHDRSE